MADAQALDVVMVEVGGGMFAFPAAVVREALLMVEPTPMPEWPPDALGLVNVRGELLALMDVAPLVGRPPLVPSAKQVILILLGRRAPWGVIVDRVDGVVSAPVRGLEEMRRETLTASGVCQGLILWTNGPVILLDPEALAQAAHLPDLSALARARS